MFENFLTDFPLWGQAGGTGFPPLNLWEDAENIYAEAELPGLTMDSVEVFVVGSELTIRGERKGLDEQGVSYHRRERGTGRFERTVMLPTPINADKVEATFKDGVLTVKMPKAEEAKPRKIKVQTA